MVAVEDFSRLVSGIYAAATGPQHWELALHDIQAALGGTVGSLLQDDRATWSFHDTTLPATALQSYREHYHRCDSVLAAVRTAEVGVVLTGPKVVVPNRNPEFYAGWMRPNELEDGLFVRLSAGPRPTCFLVGAAETGFDTTDRVRLMAALVAHLQQALRIQDNLALLRHSALEMAGALDAIRTGVVVVGHESLVVNVNSAAEDILRAEDGLCTQAGRIAATSPYCDRELQRTIRDAVVGDAAMVRGGGSLACVRPSGKRSYVVQVVPSQRRFDDVPERQQMALVTVIDPELQPEPAPELLRRQFGLTDAEAEVALHVVHGSDLRHVADELSVSLATVRTHLQHVFDKTQTHRQAELVHLLLALCP